MQPPKDCLVETDWLAAHLDAPDIVILDATMYMPGSGREAAKDYRDTHIPGALFFDVEEISDAATPLPHMLPPPEKFSARVRRMGIGDGTRIVIYDQTNMSGAARAWWMFRVMGASDVAVLNGGLTKWRAEGHRIESWRPRPRGERHFTARLNSALVRDIGDMRDLLLNDAMQIVDARSARRFEGLDPEPREVPRLGHIPGARNLPFTKLLAENGTMRSPDEIRALLAEAGIDPARSVVASCGSGVTACVIALALAALGDDTVAVYDGSWAEWSAADTPVERAGSAPESATG
jgi:thiosulfate/3-mercaptopyruvate sulfurtransferase